MEKGKNLNRKLIDIIIIMIITLFLSIPLFYSKLDVYRDDGIQHIARAYGTYESLKDNFIAPNVISSFSNNFGYSWNLFYGPLSAYGIILIRMIVKNFIVAYKIFCALCMFLSGIFMYRFVRRLTKINDIALLAAVLYMLFPYHITDLYTRNALGEYVSFIFIPIVFHGIYNIFFEENGNQYYLAIGAIGLILTHNLSTIIVAFFAICYVILKFEKITDKRIIKILLLNILFILLITGFFWLPMLQTRVSSSYAVYTEGMMATPESTANRALSLKQLFITEGEGEFVFELGLNIIIMLVFSVMSLKIITKPLREHYIFFLICGIISMWMATKYFPWKYLGSSFSYIQFPWRMLMMTSFFISIVCAINMYLVIVKFNVKDVIFISIISAFCTIVMFDTQIMGNLGIQNIEDLVLGRFSGREIETVAGTGKGEYLPENAYKDKFYLATREDNIYVLEGKAVITDEKKEGSNYSAKIKTFDSNYTIFELPYLYYPGYQVRADGIRIDNFETKNGFLGFAIGKNDNVLIDVSYEGTSLMRNSFLASIISLIVFIIINIRQVNKKDYILEKVEKNNSEGKNV